MDIKSARESCEAYCEYGMSQGVAREEQIKESEHIIHINNAKYVFAVYRLASCKGEGLRCFWCVIGWLVEALKS